MRKTCGKRISIWMAWLIAAFLLIPLSASAAEEEVMWTENYYRCVDDSGELSDLKVQTLDEQCLEFMRTYHADLSLLAIGSDMVGDRTLSDCAIEYFYGCDFGYGPDRDGFQLIWNYDTGEAWIETFGDADHLIPREQLDYIAEQIPGYAEKYGTFGPLYAGARMMEKYLGGSTMAMEQPADMVLPGDEPAEEPEQPEEVITEEPQEAEPAEETPVTRAGSDIPRVGEGADKPAWYPVSTENFPFYYDETAPRVVDDADLFTPDEEAQMDARLSEIRKELNRDIVIFTDMSTYGLERKVYAADFYDFNGYGCGEDREGVCLFICMDPEDRGWWCCCTGPATKELYTEEIANQIDDILYDYMKAGTYYTGVTDWIENFRRLYTTGSPYLSDWVLKKPEEITRFHDPDAPRVVDEAGQLSDQEISLLSQQAKTLSDQYQTDILIHVARSSGNLSEEDYANLFFLNGGYGSGENYDGIQLTVFKLPGEDGHGIVTASGSTTEKLTEVNAERLVKRFNDKIDDEDATCYDAVSAWLSQTDHMLRTGRAPRGAFSWIFWTALELLAGLIFAGISLMIARSKMETPAVRLDANNYLVKDSLQIHNVADSLVNTTTSKRYSPVETRSSGGSSGSRSSYSSSYSGSSGASHSGSGRSF